jgi:hypothetical protein
MNMLSVCFNYTNESSVFRTRLQPKQATGTSAIFCKLFSVAVFMQYALSDLSLVFGTYPLIIMPQNQWTIVIILLSSGA